jgi:hypothetical protein
VSLPVGISYSGGSSSEHLIQMVIEGVVERPEYLAVFSADTGDEHEWTYEAMEQVEERCQRAGIPFIRCSRLTHYTRDAETLPDHVLAISREGKTRAEHPPYWIELAGGGRGKIGHRCTYYFKIAPMRRAMSAWLKSIGKPKKIEQWVGFSSDEAHRAQKALKGQDVAWEKLAFPAIRLGVNRARQRAELTKWTGRAPRFSMCRKCPFKNPQRWAQTPESDLPDVYELDEAIRDLDQIGITDGPTFITDRLIPVEQLIRNGDPQPNLPGLESYCDGGACFL